MNVATLPAQSRAGRRDTGWVKLPDQVTAKLSVVVDIDANDRAAIGKELNVTVQFSTDGEKLDRPKYSWKWVGNTKTGRGDNGTTARINHLMPDGEEWMGGLFVRVLLDAPGAVRYSVSVDV